MVNHPHRSRAAISATPKRIRVPAHDHDADYAALLLAVKATFAKASKSPLFVTAVDLTDAYLDNLGRERSVHDCSACKSFLRSFGGLLTIGEDGHTASALWNEDAVPDFYHDAVTAMRKAAERAPVKGPFLSSEPVWGTPKTGVWTHLAVSAPHIHRHPLLTANQAMAAKREDFKTVARALEDFKPTVIAEAIRLLEADHLAQSRKFVTPMNWLASLHEKRMSARGKIRDNILWGAIATAPEGFCHPRAAVTGTLLEDLAAGLSFKEVKKRFDDKMHPLQYQRPQAAPAAGNLANAEAIFEKMGLAPALERRFARLDECQLAWAPFAPSKRAVPKGGVFSHLAPKGSGGQVRASGTPEAVLTWEKFCRTVLPGAEAIHAYVTGGNQNFLALTTALHDDAPPILKWDKEDDRNPFAWYLYHNGSPASLWGLSAGWTKVTGIVPLPPMWGDNPQPHLGQGFVLVLDGCADTRSGQGNALFPECLRGELHAVRSTVEAYSKRAQMHARIGASACGFDVRAANQSIGYRLRVTAGELQTDYRIDRWD